MNAIEVFFFWAMGLVAFWVFTRHVSWAAVALCATRDKGWPYVAGHLREGVVFSRGVVRFGGALLSTCGLALFSSTQALAYAALFVLLSWRVVFYAHGRKEALAAVGGALALGLIMAATGGHA